jgi:putative ABC transport system substrate-binding protein
MRRREFISSLCCLAMLPFAAHAQQAIPVVGFLDNSSPNASLKAAFNKGLSEAGYDEGRNVTIKYRWAEGRNDRLPALVEDLIARQIAVIAAVNTPSALAAKAATRTIPIVFGLGVDPVEFGLVASLNRPGGNITGVTQLSVEATAKRLELLHELVPSATLIAFLVNPTSQLYTQAEIREAQTEASLITGVRLLVVEASDEPSIEAGFATLIGEHASALLVSPDSYFVSQCGQLAKLAAHYAIPAIYHRRECTVVGGLMSYGPSLAEAYRQVGGYAGRILRGESPSDLPVQQSSTFELVVNLKTAKTLGITIPSSIMVRGDELVE